MRALFFGVSRFGGKLLASHLSKEGFQLTLVVRSEEEKFPLTGAEFLIADTHQPQTLEVLARQMNWDLVFDFSTAQPLVAQNIADRLKDRFKRYYLMSNIFVYPYGQNLHEELFDPYHYSIASTDFSNMSFVESLRNVEAIFASRFAQRLVILRLPFVFGPQDPSRRLFKIIQKVIAREPLYFPNKEAKFSFLSVDELVRAIYTIGLSPFSGVVNVGSSVPLRIANLLKWIEHYSYVNVIYSPQNQPGASTPLSIEKDFYFDVSKLKNLGIVIPSQWSYLEALVKQECDQMTHSEAY